MKQDFYSKCYEIIKDVPAGKVITYKTIANMLGTKAYRAVGTAMKRNEHSFLEMSNSKSKESNNQNSPDSWESKPLTSPVPCHRVVPSNGTVGSFNGGTKEKIRLLQKEEIEIEIDSSNLENSKILNFKDVELEF